MITWVFHHDSYSCCTGKWKWCGAAKCELELNNNNFFTLRHGEDLMVGHYSNSPILPHLRRPPCLCLECSPNCAAAIRMRAECSDVLAAHRKSSKVCGQPPSGHLWSVSGEVRELLRGRRQLIESHQVCYKRDETEREVEREWRGNKKLLLSLRFHLVLTLSLKTLRVRVGHCVCACVSFQLLSSHRSEWRTVSRTVNCFPVGKQHFCPL